MLRLEIKEAFIKKIINLMNSENLKEIVYPLPIKLMKIRVSLSEKEGKETQNRFFYKDNGKVYLLQRV